MWGAIIYAINKIQNFIIGKPQVALGVGVEFPLTGNAGKYLTVLDIQGRGELESLFFLGTHSMYVNGEFLWLHKITIDDTIITPMDMSLSTWRYWLTTSQTSMKGCGLPLESISTSGNANISSRASALTPFGFYAESPIEESLQGIKFNKSCKVELYVASSAYGGTVTAYYRAIYVQR